MTVTSLHGQPSKGAVDTLLFVDVDGVLNVGVSEKNGDCLLLTERTAQQASQLVQDRGPYFSDSAQRFLAVWDSPVPQEAGSTYASLVCHEQRHTSQVLTQRLARLIELAGERRTVVLSSSWRKPKYAAQVRELEKELTECLGETFAFDANTALRAEPTPADRLRTVADYVASHCARKLHDCVEEDEELEDVEGDGVGERRVRVVIFEDFFASPLSGWQCDGYRIDSAAAAQRYIQSRAPLGIEVSVKLIHTYDECVLPAGRRFGVGSGLTQKHFEAAARFLAAGGIDQGLWPKLSLPIAEFEDNKGACMGLSCTGGMSPLSDTISADLTGLWQLISMARWPGYPECGTKGCFDKGCFEKYAGYEDGLYATYEDGL